MEFTENTKPEKSSDVSMEGANRPRESNDFLDSWKEISLFLKRGIRTVQRWEATEGLPVHRHQHLKRGTVFAFPSEIQGWLKTRDLNKLPNADGPAETPASADGESASDIEKSAA